MSTMTSTQPEDHNSSRLDEPEVVKRLLGDTNGKALEELKFKISEGRRQAQEELNAGVGPEDFRALTDFVTATNAAEEIIEAFWNQTHAK